MALLREALDPAGAGCGLFFSHGADLTLTQERWAAVAANAKLAAAPLWRRADARFFWNRHLTLLLTGARSGRRMQVARRWLLLALVLRHGLQAAAAFFAVPLCTRCVLVHQPIDAAN